MKEKLNAFFKYVFEEELLNEIAKVGIYKEVKKGELLIDVDQKIEGIPLLLSGAIKVLREDKNGDEMVLYFLERGDTCAGSFANALSHRKCGVRGIAEKDSEVILLPIEKIDSWMTHYKSWREFIINSYDDRLNEIFKTLHMIYILRE